MVMSRFTVVQKAELWERWKNPLKPVSRCARSR